MLIDVSEQSQTGEARRRALACAQGLAMDEVRSGAVAVAATEIATNLVKHAGRGHILLQQLARPGNAGLRVMGVDKGPGISDIAGALADGHSTAGSMGGGLGAIRRLSDCFDLYSMPGSGTVVSAEFWRQKGAGPARNASLEVGVISEPIFGEEFCGDGWGVRDSAEGTLMMVVDGLGHGILAAEAAREAERVLLESKESSPQQIIQDTHCALRKTRGAAQGIARIEANKRLLTFAGVGNISASIVAPGTSRSMASHNGTLGHQMQRVQEFTCPWNADSILVMHSDGLTSRWDLNRYPGLWGKPASVIAAVLHRDFFRGRDDVTVLVAKAA
jgi:anti-sigma regulatory factor (Ser/Thr protein kinase)